MTTDCNHKWVDYTDRDGKTEALCLYCPMSKVEFDCQQAKAARTVADPLPTPETSPFLYLLTTRSLHPHPPTQLGKAGLYLPIQVEVSPSTGTTSATFFLSEANKHARLSDWLPTKLEKSDNFYGVNRNASRIGLVGYYHESRAPKIFDSIPALAGLVGRQGGWVDYVFCRQSLWDDLLEETGATRSFAGLSGPWHSMMTLKTTYGALKVIPDNTMCEMDVLYGVYSNDWHYDPQFGLYCTRPERNAIAKLLPSY